MYLNKAQLIGNLTKEPELKALPSGVKVLNFSIATNRTWKDKNGEKKEEAEFHNVVAFGKTAEVIAQYVKKGDQIYLEGRLQTRSWEDKDLQKKMYRTEILLENFQFGNKSKNNAGGAGSHKEVDNSVIDISDTPEAKNEVAEGISEAEATLNGDIPF